MLSSRCYKILSLLNIFHPLGFTSLYFCTKTLLVKNDTLATSRTYKVLKLNYLLSLVWNAGAISILWKLYQFDNVDFYITCVYHLTLILVSGVFTIVFILSPELCELANCVLKFLRFLHSKSPSNLL